MANAERELLLIVARWMLRLEGGVFDDMRPQMPPSELAAVERQLEHVRSLIAEVEAER